MTIIRSGLPFLAFDLSCQPKKEDDNQQLIPLKNHVIDVSIFFAPMAGTIFIHSQLLESVSHEQVITFVRNRQYFKLANRG